MNTDQALSREGARAGIWLLAFGIILVATNLRAPITAVGPIIGEIRDHTGISNTVAGLLTTLPLLAFALLSPLAPKISRRFGMEQTIMYSLLVLLTGIVLRSLHSVWLLFIGTALLGLAIALGNVLIPSLIKRDFPQKVGVMTGAYSMAMNLFAAIASGVSIPIAHGLSFGWQGSLICWAILAFIALAVWVPQLRKNAQTAVSVRAGSTAGAIWKSPLAWKVTLFMGLQSLVFYVGIAWIPQILQDQGVSPSAAGWMLFLMQFASLPGSFLMPVLAGRVSNQRLLVAITTGCMFIGYAGLLAGNTVLMPLWIILIGIAGGCSFSLAVMFFSLRTRSAAEAAELSGMAQSVGYLLAALGPTLFGFIHDVTQGWTMPLFLLLIVAFLLFLVGLGAGKNVYLTSAEKSAAS
ncbi:MULTISPECIES: CynX/NimT family MFS transporter [Brevibacillus]|jgi:CP family cyanate transporter-like MFS transporter|uniref:Major facilitator superfamily protein n=1 Tax=Brevibacillus borstelensis AK1 TaxID=1300222 RepID=M8E5R6_9BACL|nr:MFS transporter [Brevibacillus borstelensis]EMT50815.1 major facilitator superfamily protein [Brevibacillus borstelensis AK1]KKX55875.1 transporter [Brevibacillus borstelensis cifa_chp40]MBE5396690.1 MFS transporter [Brevibacillus borstelensis]MED1743373.1 MFS transporter [Brevibacillus borstelensis]MED1885384.1 MFS transporter [Brevibacillus borstelensis]